MKRTFIVLALALTLGLIIFSSTASALIPGIEDQNGFKFKEILWDAGWIWLLMLVMGVAAIFDFIRDIIASTRKGGQYEEPEERTKPSYEIILRKRIE